MKRLLFFILPILISFNVKAVDITNFWVQKRSDVMYTIYWTSLDESDCSQFVLERNRETIFTYFLEQRWLSSVYYFTDRPRINPDGYYYVLYTIDDQGNKEARKDWYVAPPYFWNYWFLKF